MARSNRKRLAAIAFVALLVPLVVACNALIGLDEFDKVECPGRRCADGGGPDTSVPDAFVDDGPAEARGADPAAWAEWPMPNYDAGADFLPNQLDYAVLD